MLVARNYQCEHQAQENSWHPTFTTGKRAAFGCLASCTESTSICVADKVRVRNRKEKQKNELKNNELKRAIEHFWWGLRTQERMIYEDERGNMHRRVENIVSSA